MGDAARVRRVHRFGERNRDREQCVHRHAMAWDAGAQRLSVHQFHRQEVDAVDVFDRVDGDDVRVGERGDGARFLGEAFAALVTERHQRRQHLQGDAAMQAEVVSGIHLAHPAGADRGGDAVVPERPTDHAAYDSRTPARRPARLMFDVSSMTRLMCLPQTGQEAS